MNNFEKWMKDLQETKRDVPWECLECPAKDYCDVYNDLGNCAEVFAEWAKKEAELKE